MLALKARAGERRGLNALIATAGAGRVLDLHALSVNLPDDPEYVARPLFIHPVLNRSIIMKYNVPAGQTDKLAPRRFNATKVVFAFDQRDLGMGGQALFVDQPDFAAALARQLDYKGLNLDRDIEVLRALDSLPTLDPFLICETLNQKRIEAGRCYFQISEADKAQMQAFVAGEIGALIALCFGEGKANAARTQRLSRLLLAEQEHEELGPLREIFRMDAAEFSKAMFCWKAFLYYRWRGQVLSARIRPTLRALAAIRTGRYDRLESSFVSGAKRQIELCVTRAWREVGQSLTLYDKAFSSLTGRQNPDDFRVFLAAGSVQFAELGARIGLVEQVVSFWDYAFSPDLMIGLSPYEVLDGLRDLMQALSIRAGLDPTMAATSTGAQEAGGSGAGRRRAPAAAREPNSVGAA